MHFFSNQYLVYSIHCIQSSIRFTIRLHITSPQISMPLTHSLRHSPFTAPIRCSRYAASAKARARQPEKEKQETEKNSRKWQKNDTNPSKSGRYAASTKVWVMRNIIKTNKINKILEMAEILKDMSFKFRIKCSKRRTSAE